MGLRDEGAAQKALGESGLALTISVSVVTLLTLP